MIDSDKLTKLYYSISEVADMFEVNTSLIRFWEKEFTFIKPKKNKKGNRTFTPQDIQKIELVYQLVKKEGYTLEGAKKHFKQAKSKKATGHRQDEIQTKLEDVKRRLIALKQQLT